ncbi:MAG: hypothetical protein R6U11_07685 [Bacteroidales bacterium]
MESLNKEKALKKIVTKLNEMSENPNPEEAEFLTKCEDAHTSLKKGVIDDNVKDVLQIIDNG